MTETQLPRVEVALDVPGRTGDAACRGDSWRRGVARRLAVADLIVVCLAVATGYWVRFGAEPYELAGVSYPEASALLVIGWMGSLAGFRAYETRLYGVGTEEFRRLVVATFALFGVLAIVSYAFKLTVPRGFVAVAMPLGLTLLILERLTMRLWLQRQRAQGRLTHRVVVVGNHLAAEALAAQVAREPYAGFTVVGACLPPGDQPLPGVALPVLGSLDRAREVAEQVGADTVAVSASPEISAADLRRLAWSLEGYSIDLIVVPAVTEVAGPRISVRPVGGLPLLYVDEPTFTGARRVAKRAVDVAVAGLGLLVLGVPLLMVALLVRLTSPGKALFMQARVGRAGHAFQVRKLRTMYADAEARLAELQQHNETDGLLFKMAEDPRITPLGRFLRRASIDELPQLINVLRGDMSLVGPRPLPVNDEDFEGDVRRRLLVRPGITGLWQVSGRSDTSWEDAVRLDLYYVENWSLALDLTIMLRTVLAVWRGEGAY